MFSWLYHGKNRKQCYYEPACVVCFIRAFLRIIQIAGEDPCTDPTRARGS